MNGTCIETQPQKVEGEDELYQFTFFSDISINTETIDLVQTIHFDIKNTLTNMQRYLNRWKKYRSIWKVDKVSVGFHLKPIIPLQNELFGGYTGISLSVHQLVCLYVHQCTKY